MAIQDDLSDKHAPIRAVMRRIEILERTGSTLAPAGGGGESATYSIGVHNPAAPGAEEITVQGGATAVAIEMAVSTTIVGAETRGVAMGTVDWHVECWTLLGSEGAGYTLGTKIGASDPISHVNGTGAGEPVWWSFPAFSWPVQAGTRYAIILWQPESSGPRSTTDSTPWTEPFEITGLGTVPAKLGFMFDPKADAEWPKVPDKPYAGMVLVPDGYYLSFMQRLLPQMRLITATGGGMDGGDFSAGEAMSAYLAAIA